MTALVTASDLDLPSLFDALNQRWFDGFLETPALEWNTRLRASAGRFIPGKRSLRWRPGRPARIELARYLLEEANSLELVNDTLGHEMIHYWLWTLGRPHGHTPDFYLKMNQMGVSRYNSVPRTRPFRYAYRCPGCAKEFFSRRRLGVLACTVCCTRHAGGRFDPRFRLVLDRELEDRELHAAEAGQCRNESG